MILPVSNCKIACLKSHLINDLFGWHMYTQNPNDKPNDMNSNMELNVYMNSTQRMAHIYVEH